ncbi:hypothetical protein [Nocardia sp. NPDC059229]|uniref:hypothetical protein n=1 Tax=Nocardia sp. NPDC059229 TaxID=3346778 RepID=UPI0036CFB9E5
MFEARLPVGTGDSLEGWCGGLLEALPDIVTTGGTRLRIREAEPSDAVAIRDTMIGGFETSLSLVDVDGGAQWVPRVLAAMKDRHLRTSREFLDEIARGIGTRKIFVAETSGGHLAGYSQIEICTDEAGETPGQMEAWRIRREFFARKAGYRGISLATRLMDVPKKYAVRSGGDQGRIQYDEGAAVGGSSPASRISRAARRVSDAGVVACDGLPRRSRRPDHARLVRGPHHCRLTDRNRARRHYPR